MNSQTDNDLKKLKQDPYARHYTRLLSEYQGSKRILQEGIDAIHEKGFTPLAAPRVHQLESLGRKRLGERGWLGDAASHTARGAVSLAEHGAQGIKTFTGGVVGGGAAKYSKNLPQSTPFLRPDASEVEGEGIVKRGFAGALESAPMTGAIFAGGLTGAKLGTLALPGWGTAIGGILGSGVAMLTLFGAGTFGRRKDEVTEELRVTRPDLSETQIDKMSSANAMTHAKAEVFGESISDAAAYLIFRRIPGGKMAYKGAKAMLKDLVLPGAVKTIAKGVAKDMPFEVGSEVGTAYYQHKADEKIGVEKGTLLENMGEAIIPAMFLSGGIGVALGTYNAQQRKVAYNSLNSEDSKIREAAIHSVAGSIEQATGEKEVAQKWLNAAMQYVNDGQAIPLDTGFSEFIAEEEAHSKDKEFQDIPAAENVLTLIDEGLASGEMGGKPFTPETAMAVIKQSYGKAITDEHIDQLKEKYPELGPGLNEIIGDRLKDQISEEMDKGKVAESIKGVVPTQEPMPPAVPETTPEDQEFVDWQKKADTRTFSQEEIDEIDDYVEEKTRRKEKKEEDIAFKEWSQKAFRGKTKEERAIQEAEDQEAYEKEVYGFKGLSPYLKESLDRLEQGEPGMRVKNIDLDGTERWSGFSSTYPEWFQNQGWSKVQAIKALKRGLAGEPFADAFAGKGQGQIWDAAMAAAQERLITDMMEYAKEIESNPELIQGMPLPEYKIMLEVLHETGTYAGPITEASALFRETVEGQAVRDVSEELGISEEEFRSILEDENRPGISLDQAWESLSKEDLDFMNWIEDSKEGEDAYRAKGREKIKQLTLDTIRRDLADKTNLLGIEHVKGLIGKPQMTDLGITEKDLAPIISRFEKKASAPQEERTILDEIDKPAIKEDELINGITRKEAGEKIVKGDESVLDHIEEGVEKHGPMQMQDAIRNQAMKEISEAKTPEERKAMMEKYRDLKPDLDEILSGKKEIDLEVKKAEGKVKPEKPGKPESLEGQVPDFADTEEAESFGRQATPDQIEALESKQRENKKKPPKLTSREDFDEAFKRATKNQFVNEALSAVEAKEKGAAKEKPAPVKKEPWEMTLVDYAKSKLPESQANQITDESQAESFRGQYLKDMQGWVDAGKQVSGSILKKHGLRVKKEKTAPKHTKKAPKEPDFSKMPLDDIMVETPAVDGKTGKIVITEVTAKEALDQNKSETSLLDKLLACLQG